MSNQGQLTNDTTVFSNQTLNKNFNNKICNQRKKINFNRIVSAILIPSIKDMDTELRSQLWWDKIDYLAFCNSANNEINTFLKIHTGLTRKDAVRLLYDHSIIFYDEHIINDIDIKFL
jgi:hypothetical protein